VSIDGKKYLDLNPRGRSPLILTVSSETACPSSGSSKGRLQIILAASRTSFPDRVKAATKVPDWYRNPKAQPSNFG
jgi:hypothetical protein